MVVLGGVDGGQGGLTCVGVLALGREEPGAEEGLLTWVGGRGGGTVGGGPTSVVATTGLLLVALNNGVHVS